METIFREVKNIDADERRVYESVVGHALENDQWVVIRIVGSGNGSQKNVSRSPEEWSEQKNDRRLDLIDKEIEGNLSPEEGIELDDLQRQASAYRDLMAPLPMEGARKLHRDLLAKKRCQQQE